MEWELTFRVAHPSDAELLGRLNFLLIRDEGRRNPMSESELVARMQWLRSDLFAKELLPVNTGISVDALCHNSAGLAFWRSLGFQDYSLSLELE
ncbi:MAG TPA: hypothetical protein VFO40_14205 [Chthoniobacterales bacterium]|nr:hypothetical protein [Chthoniobacterales bacterium]